MPRMAEAIIMTIPKNAKAEYNPLFSWKNTKRNVAKSAPPIISLFPVEIMARIMERQRIMIPIVRRKITIWFFFIS